MARRAARVKVDLREGALAPGKILAHGGVLGGFVALFCGLTPTSPSTVTGISYGTSSRLTGRAPGELGKDLSVQRVAVRTSGTSRADGVPVE